MRIMLVHISLCSLVTPERDTPFLSHWCHCRQDSMLWLSDDYRFDQGYIADQCRARVCLTWFTRNTAPSGFLNFLPDRYLRILTVVSVLEYWQTPVSGRSSDNWIFIDVQYRMPNLDLTALWTDFSGTFILGFWFDGTRRRKIVGLPDKDGMPRWSYRAVGRHCKPRGSFLVYRDYPKCDRWVR